MWIDITFLIIAGFAFYKGYNAGIIKTVLWIVSVLVAMIVTMRYAGEVTNLLQEITSSDNPFIFLLAFFLTFVLVISIIRWGGSMIEKFLGQVRLNFFNRYIGGIMYALLATILYSSVLGLFDQMTWIKPAAKDHSMTWPLLAAVPKEAGKAYDGLKPIFGEFVEETTEMIEEGRKK